jgi:hypothetical protein
MANWSMCRNQTLKIISLFSKRLWALPDWLKLAALALITRLPNLGYERLWFDEAFTAWQTRGTSDFWKAVMGDVHPPLWPLIEWFNQQLFGFSELTFRLPALLFGIGVVLLIWQIALALEFPRRTAFTAGLLACILPAGVYFAQDARMYAALSFCVLLTLLGTLRSNWCFWVIGGIGAVYAHNMGVLYFAAIAVSILLPGLRGGKRSMMLPYMACAGVAAAWLPWAGFALPQQLAMVKADYWVPALSPAGVLMPYLETTMGWRIAHGLQIPAFFAVIASTLVALIAARRWLYREGLPVLAVIFGGPALLAGLSIFWKSVYVFRPVVPASMALCLIWAYMLQHLSLPNRRVAQAVLWPALIAGLLCGYTMTLREDLAAWVAPIREQFRPGDFIYHTDSTTWINYGWYLQGLPQSVYPAPGSTVTVSDSAKVAMQMQQARLDQLDPAVYKRFWLIYSPNPYTRQSEVDEITQIKATYMMTLIKAKTGDTRYFGDYIYLGKFR